MQKFGHPSIDSVGEIAAFTPYFVIHHAQGGFKIRKKHFNLLHLTYENGDISDASFSFLLNRMYQIKFGERHEIDGPFRTEEEIKTLIQKLELTSSIPID